MYSATTDALAHERSAGVAVTALAQNGSPGSSPSPFKKPVSTRRPVPGHQTGWDHLHSRTVPRLPLGYQANRLPSDLTAHLEVSSPDRSDFPAGRLAAVDSSRNVFLGALLVPITKTIEASLSESFRAPPWRPRAWPHTRRSGPAIVSHHEDGAPWSMLELLQGSKARLSSVLVLPGASSSASVAEAGGPGPGTPVPEAAEVRS